LKTALQLRAMQQLVQTLEQLEVRLSRQLGRKMAPSLVIV
jgi:hypothetical protein